MKLITFKSQRGMALKGQGDVTRDGMMDDFWNTTFLYSSPFQNHGNLSNKQKRMKINKGREGGKKLNKSEINETYCKEGELSK